MKKPRKPRIVVDGNRLVRDLRDQARLHMREARDQMAEARRVARDADEHGYRAVAFSAREAEYMELLAARLRSLADDIERGAYNL